MLYTPAPILTSVGLVKRRMHKSLSSASCFSQTQLAQRIAHLGDLEADQGLSDL